MKKVTKTVQQFLGVIAISGAVFMTSCSSDDSNDTPPPTGGNTTTESEVQALKAVFDANPEAQSKLGWDFNEIDLSKWNGVVLNADGTIRALDLSDKSITVIPSEIGDLTSLIELQLEQNDIETLPSEISALIAIERLDISGNRFTEIPSGIFSLTALEFLDCEENDIEILPAEIEALVALQTLDISGNAFTSLPVEIGALIALEAFDLSDNESLTSLPDVFIDLESLLRIEIDQALNDALSDELKDFLDDIVEIDIPDVDIPMLNAQIQILRAEIEALEAREIEIENVLDTERARITAEILATGNEVRTNAMARANQLENELEEVIIRRTEAELQGNTILVAELEEEEQRLRDEITEIISTIEDAILEATAELRAELNAEVAEAEALVADIEAQVEAKELEIDRLEAQLG